MPQPRRVALMLDYGLLFKQHSEVFAGAQQFADQHGWVTFIDEWADKTLQHADPDHLPYDGVIGRVNKNSLDLIQMSTQHGLPVVNVLRDTPAFDHLPGVFPDFEQMGKLRAEHLLSRGLRRFAYFGRSPVPEQVQMKSFIATIEQAGYETTVYQAQSDATLTFEWHMKTQGELEQWMDTWELPIGFCGSLDHLARQVAQMCRERGWRVPGDVAIIGGMNEEKMCDQPKPSLTSVEVGFHRVGYEAARMLARLMDDADQARRNKTSKKRSAQKAASPMHLTLPPVGLVVRDSTDFYAVDDPAVAQSLVYISDKCHLNLSVGDVAEAAGVSTRTLQYRFSDVLGRSVAQELRRVRIEKAKRGLVGSDRSIDDIAQQAGFASRSHLYEVFKRDVGITPSAYRKQRRVEAKALAAGGKHDGP